MLISIFFIFYTGALCYSQEFFKGGLWFPQLCVTIDSIYIYCNTVVTLFHLFGQVANSIYVIGMLPRRHRLRRSRHRRLGAVLLVTWLMPMSSYVTYILAFCCHWCTSRNFGI